MTSQNSPKRGTFRQTYGFVLLGYSSSHHITTVTVTPITESSHPASMGEAVTFNRRMSKSFIIAVLALAITTTASGKNLKVYFMT